MASTKKPIAMLTVVLTIVAILSVGAAQLSPVRADLTFASPINLSNNAGISRFPQIAMSGNNVYVVWVDDTPGNDDIFLRASTNTGATFGLTINLSNNPGISRQPQMAAAGNNVYVAWRDETPGNSEVFFRATTDQGATFGSPINLSNNPGYSSLPQIAAAGNSVYVVWGDNTLGNNEVLFRASTDGGASFGSTINLSNNPGISSLPKIAASGDRAYLAWRDDTSGNAEILFRASGDRGASFGSTINLSNNPGLSTTPQIASSGDNVYVAWPDDTSGNSEIFLSASTDGGASFGSTINLSNNPGLSTGPMIAATADNGYVAWRDDTPGNSEIFFTASTDKGATFGATINLSNSIAGSFSPDIVAAGGNVFVAWQEEAYPNSNEVFLSASSNQGKSFGSAVNVSKSPNLASGQEELVVGVCGVSACVVYREEEGHISDEVFIACVRLTIHLQTFFSDTAGNPLPTDTDGQPMVQVVAPGGVARSTNPGALVAILDASNPTSTTFGTSVQISDALPQDFALQPEWKGRSTGNVKVCFYEASAFPLTNFPFNPNWAFECIGGADITGQVSFAGTTQGLVMVSIPNSVLSALGGFGPGDHITVSTKMKLALKGSPLPAGYFNNGPNASGVFFKLFTDSATATVDRASTASAVASFRGYLKDNACTTACP